MNLDLSKFKKADSNDKYTILAHPKGHHIKISHSGLSEGMRKQLEDLPIHKAKGGDVSKPSKAKMDPAYTPPAEAKDAYTEPDNMGTHIPPQLLKEEMKRSNTTPDVVVNALDRKAPPFGPLGDEAKHHSPPCINPNCKSYGQSHPNCRCYGGKMMMAKGGEVEQFCSKNRAHEEGCEYYEEGGPVQAPEQKENYHEKYWKDMMGNQNHDQKVKDRNKKISNEPQQVLTLAEGTPDEPISNDPSMEVPPEVAQKYQTMINSDNKGQKEISRAEEAAPSPAQSLLNLANLGKNKVSNQNVQQQQNTDVSPEIASQNQQSQVENGNPLDTLGQEQTPNLNHQNNYEKHLNQMLEEQDKYQTEVDSGVIDPPTYESMFNEKELPGKMGTLFGLLISGIGSGMSHQPNMVMQMMDNEIQRDIQAQEKSQENRQNFLKLNQQNFMNVANADQLTTEARVKSYAQATAMARYAFYDKYARMTRNLPPGQMKNQAVQALAIMKPAIDQENSSGFARAAAASAVAETLFGAQGNQPNTLMMKAGFLGPEGKELGQDIEQKSLYGDPSVKGQTSKKPLERADIDRVNDMNTLHSKMNDLINYSAGHWGTISPSERATAMQKALEAVGFYSNSLGTSMTEGTRAWLDKQLAEKNPTSIVGQLMGSQAKLKEIRDSNLMRKQMLLTKMGFSPTKTDHNDSQIKTMNGANYRPVSGGWQRVK